MGEEEADLGDSILRLDAEIAELERLTTFLDEFCAREGVPDETCYQLQVALEELVINAIKHGGCGPEKGAIRLAMRRVGSEVIAVLSDNGIAFNPLEAPPPNLVNSLHSRPVGGLGIHLVRHLVPSIRYERHGGRNYVYLIKPVTAGSGAVSLEEESHANGNGDNQS